MYVPASFAENDLETLHSFMEQHSFATIVSVSGDEPVASHMPLLLDRDEGERGRLIGHLAKANPQVNGAADQDVLVIFHGPHTYISPAWYQEKNVVPTWNYIAVHAYGRLSLIEDADDLAEIVRRYVEVYEAQRDPPWSIDSIDQEFASGLVGGITGFQVDIDRIEGKWKLNQNHSRERRQRVIDALDGGTHDQQQIADWMKAAFSDQRAD